MPDAKEMYSFLGALFLEYINYKIMLIFFFFYIYVIILKMVIQFKVSACIVYTLLG